MHKKSLVINDKAFLLFENEYLEIKTSKQLPIRIHCL